MTVSAAERMTQARAALGQRLAAILKRVRSHGDHDDPDITDEERRRLELHEEVERRYP